LKRKRLEEGKNHEAKVRLRLEFLELEVRGIVFKHNLFLPISYKCLFDK